MSNTEAQGVAMMLTDFFLSEGCFDEVPGGSQGIDAANSALPANAVAQLTAFHGLAVRAVGYSEHQGGRCYIYVTQSSKRAVAKLPSKLGGVAVAVEKVGRVAIRPEAAFGATNTPQIFRTKGRIACGSSVAPAGEDYAGTLGALLSKNGKLYALSNNHVFGGCNHIPKGQPITSPSSSDARPNGPQIIQFATLDSVVELRSGDIGHVRQQQVDAAIALVDDHKKVSSMQGGFYDTPTQSRAPKIRERVQKVGRTTAHTVGVVQSRIPSLFTLPYKSKHFAATVNYSDIWVVQAADGGSFALPGDSGSLVVSEDGASAVGQVFAASKDGKLAFMTSIVDVLKELGGYKLVGGL